MPLPARMRGSAAGRSWGWCARGEPCLLLGYAMRLVVPARARTAPGLCCLRPSPTASTRAPLSRPWPPHPPTHAPHSLVCGVPCAAPARCCRPAGLWPLAGGRAHAAGSAANAAAAAGALVWPQQVRRAGGFGGFSLFCFFWGGLPPQGQGGIAPSRAASVLDALGRGGSGICILKGNRPLLCDDFGMYIEYP